MNRIIINGFVYDLVKTDQTDKCASCALYEWCVSSTKNLCKTLFGDIAYNKQFVLTSKGEVLDELYYIENTVDEWHTSIKGYFSSLDKAKEALKDCCDWYRPKGTGRIYKINYGLYGNEEPELVYENK